MYEKPCLFIVAIGMLLFHGLLHSAEYNSTTLLFPEITYKHISYQSPKTTQESDTHFAFTGLHVGSNQTLNTLVEVHANEHHEKIERLQLGFDFADSHKVWFGKGHSPIGYWNTEYHHGSYLQTSLSRPNPTTSVLPRHLTGISLEGTFASFEDKISYNIVTGLAPVMSYEGLDDFDIVGSNDDNKLGIAGQLIYTPDEFGDTKIGLSLGYFSIKSQRSDLDDFKKSLASVFINWQQNDHRFISEVFYIHTDKSTEPNTNDDYFGTGYVQYEHRLTHTLTAYGRIEDVYNENNSTLQQIHSNFTKEGQFAGLRYDFLDHQALTVEVALVKEISGKKTESVSLKWNAVFP